MKLTNKNIATYFGVTPKTIGNYSNSTDPKIRRRYDAFLKMFIEENQKGNIMNTQEILEQAENKEKG